VVLVGCCCCQEYTYTYRRIKFVISYLLFNSSSSRLDYYTCRAWQDPWMSLALSGQPRWCDTPPRVHSERPAQQDKNLILTISNVRQKFWFQKIISKKKTIFIENLSWTDVFYL
jgi:hypothetical protein